MLRWTIFLLWIGLAACASMQLAWDYDEQADFSVLQRYDWLPAPQMSGDGPQIRYDGLLESRLRSAVDEQLHLKGFQRASERPDFLVAYHVAVEQRLSVTYLNELYGYGPDWGYTRHRRLYGYPGRAATLSEYQQGTLILDVVQAEDGQLIWRGSASDELYPDLSAQARERRLAEAVQKILAPFPPSEP